MSKSLTSVYWVKTGNKTTIIILAPEDMKMSEDATNQLSLGVNSLIKEAGKGLITKRKFNSIMEKKWKQGIGEPLCFVKSEAQGYFDRKLKSSNDFIKSLVENFGIKNKKIVSIGAGFGAEEILFSLMGNNEVYCIEPDKMSYNFIKKQAKKHKANIKAFQDSVKTFNSEEKFDVIYTSSPSDWMVGEELVPQRYLDFFKRYSKGIIILRLYAGKFNKALFTNKDFGKIMRVFFPDMSFYLWPDENQAVIITGAEGKEIAGFNKLKVGGENNKLKN